MNDEKNKNEKQKERENEKIRYPQRGRVREKVNHLQFMGSLCFIFPL